MEERITQRLLSMAGTGVERENFPEGFPALAVLLEHGAFLLPVTLRSELGKARHCHENALVLCRENPGYSLGTGFALWLDGIWRPHSWVLAPERGLIETTAARLAYYGVSLTLESERS